MNREKTEALNSVNASESKNSGRSRKQSIIIVLIFIIFIGGMSAGTLFLPHEDFSEAENRYLQKMPEMTGESIMNGEFMTSFEKWVSDHTVFRDEWVGLKALTEALSGKKETGGVYLADGDTLIAASTPVQEKVFENNISYVNKFAQAVDVPVYFGIIPTAAEIWADRLPAYAPVDDESIVIARAYDGNEAICVDIEGALRVHAAEDIYYRTDHHWTGLGAFYGMNALLEKMEIEKLRLEDYPKEVVSEDFCGTSWSSSGAHWVKPDTIDKYVSEEGTEVTSWYDTKPEKGSLYHEEYLEKKDKYCYFLGENQPLCVIKTNVEGPKLLLVRDSYGDNMAPFLTQRFSEIHLVDLRYNRTSTKQYIIDNDIDAVFIMYGYGTFVKDTNVVFLSK